MAAKDYIAASEAFSKAMVFVAKKRKVGEIDPELLMIQMFNLSEATRRATQTADADTWKPVAEFFEIAGTAIAAPLAVQANRWQAMHIPYALTGNLTRAREALAKAREAAKRLGPTEDVFCVKDYIDVSQEQFLEINNEFLFALERGELWDGMRLPKASSAPELDETKGNRLDAPPEKSGELLL